MEPQASTHIFITIRTTVFAWDMGAFFVSITVKIAKILKK
jgi:hypothetical protein